MTVTKKGVTYSAEDESEVVDCLFCKIQQKKEPATIVFEDEEFVVFKTIAPASKLHLLVTPRLHIRNLRSLNKYEDAELIHKMKFVGERSIIAVDENALRNSPIQFCFHVPPWNSIDHLHLHAIAYPNEMNFGGFFKYNTYLPFCELADNTIKRLLQLKK